jgi:hypothetical protein
MSNVEIREASEQDLLTKPYSEIAGDGNWSRFSSEKYQICFKSRGGLVRSIRAVCKHYQHQHFVAYVGQINGCWEGFYKVAA